MDKDGLAQEFMNKSILKFVNARHCANFSHKKSQLSWLFI
jgi:hypothetical protein